MVHHPLHSFSPEVGVGAYMVMGAYKVLYSRLIGRQANRSMVW